MKEELVKKLSLAGAGTITTIGVGLALHLVIKKLYPHSSELSSEQIADLVEKEEDPKVILKELALLMGIELGVTAISVIVALAVQKAVEEVIFNQTS